jgi:hypothetical protein
MRVWFLEAAAAIAVAAIWCHPLAAGAATPQEVCQQPGPAATQVTSPPNSYEFAMQVKKLAADSVAAATTATKRVTDACAKSYVNCLAQFPHFGRTDLETNVNVKGGFLSIFKASDQTFYGYAQEIYYTEVCLHSVQYQIGFGYSIAAHQQDAQASGSGDVSAVQVSGNADAGFTTFSTSLIGLAPPSSVTCPAPPTPPAPPPPASLPAAAQAAAPTTAAQAAAQAATQAATLAATAQAATKAAATQAAAAQASAAQAATAPGVPPTAPAPATPATAATPDQALLCAVNITPTVNQTFFDSATNALSSALHTWIGTAWNSQSQICPQIINYRAEDPKLRTSAPLQLSASQWADAIAIQEQLQKVCANPLSNVHVYYSNGLPKRASTIGLSIAGGSASYSQTITSQGYYRDVNYLGAIGRLELYDDSDQYSEVSIHGLTAAASQPSLFAAFVTASGTIQNQRIQVYTQCVGGAKAVTISALDASSGDPSTQASNYTGFFQALRTATDGGSCPTAG